MEISALSAFSARDFLSARDLVRGGVDFLAVGAAC